MANDRPRRTPETSYVRRYFIYIFFFYTRVEIITIQQNENVIWKLIIVKCIEKKK